MFSKLKIGCAQMTATVDIQDNLHQAEKLIHEASNQGLEFIALPEAFDFLSPDIASVHQYSSTESEHLALQQLGRLAKELSIWILAGSVSMRSSDNDPVNRSVLFDSTGNTAAWYDKVHLFDVDLPNGTAFRESDIYKAGDRTVVADTPWGGVGLSICYDLRFPGQYRSMAQSGAKIIMVPAAFSSFTGPLHWHVLLRARAIETGCFIIAPAQCGTNHEGRISYGHSLIVDPWGRIIADGESDVGLISSVIDLDEVDRFRAAIPSLHSSAGQR